MQDSHTLAAMRGTQPEEIIPLTNVEQELSKSEQGKPNPLGNVTANDIDRMQQWAVNYRKRHPKISPAKLARMVCKKFNVKLK